MATRATITSSAAGRRCDQQRQAGTTAAWSLAALTDPIGSLPSGSRDSAALLWDLTVRQLNQAFAQCLGPLPSGADGSPTGGGAWTLSTLAGFAGVRLAATRHAVNDIQSALRRMTAGTYGSCERCAQLIDAARLQATPATRFCTACQALLCR